MCDLFSELIYAITQFCSFFIITVYFILTFLIGLAESEYSGLIVRTGELAVNVFLIKYLKVADVRTLKCAVTVFIGLTVIKIARYCGFSRAILTIDEGHFTAEIKADIPVGRVASYTPDPELSHFFLLIPVFFEPFHRNVFCIQGMPSL